MIEISEARSVVTDALVFYIARGHVDKQAFSDALRDRGFNCTPHRVAHCYAVSFEAALCGWVFLDEQREKVTAVAADQIEKERAG